MKSKNEALILITEKIFFYIGHGGPPLPANLWFTGSGIARLIQPHKKYGHDGHCAALCGLALMSEKNQPEQTVCLAEYQ